MGIYCNKKSKRKIKPIIKIKNKQNTENSIKNIVSLNNIHSKYIIQDIFSYIEDANFFYKLIKYSKSIQNTFNISLLNYEEIYSNKRINYEDYLCYKELKKQDKLFENGKQELEDKISFFQIDKNNINKFVINYFKNYLNLNNHKYCLYENSKDIDFNCLFFDTLSKTEFFGKIFNIIIPSKIIRKENLKNEYLSKFKQLNDSNINYSSITLYYNDKDDINYLKDFNINFNQIKKLKIIPYQYKSVLNNKFWEILLSFNIQNKLISLDIHFYYNGAPNLFENINNFKLLEYLGISDMEFNPTFELKLNSLKRLKIDGCKNFTFRNGIFFKLEELIVISFSFTKTDELIEIPNLKTLYLENTCNFELIIDFLSLKKLKYFTGESNLFLLLDNSPLEKINLLNKHCQRKEIGEKVFKKIISMNTPKEISFHIELKMNGLIIY